MKRFIILLVAAMLLTACNDTDNAQPSEGDVTVTNEQETSTAEETSDETTVTPTEFTEGEDPILKEVDYDSVKIIEIMKERVASITEYTGAVNKLKTDVYLEDRTYSSYDLTYTATEVGQYNSDRKFKVHYKQEIEYPEEKLTYESYYYPDDIWYLKNSFANEWSYFDLSDLQDEENQIDFFASPKVFLDYLMPVADLGHITMHDEEQGLMEIAFELNSNTHYDIVAGLFVSGLDYMTNFYHDAIYDLVEDETVYLYVIVDTTRVLPLSFTYNHTMDSKDVEGTIETTATQSYDFTTPVDDIIIPEEVIAEATQGDLAQLD